VFSFPFILKKNLGFGSSFLYNETKHYAKFLAYNGCHSLFWILALRGKKTQSRVIIRAINFAF